MRLVILDRDGVINRDSDAYIKSPSEWVPLPGSLEAIARLKRAGYTVVVASNQSGVGRGLFGPSTLNGIHEKMQTALAAFGAKLDGIYYCPHRPDEQCTCRKPAPGLLQQIAAQFHVALDDVPAIGDSLRDLQAARAVHARPILVLTGKGRDTQEHLPADFSDTEVYPDLAAAVDALLEERQ